MSVINSDSSVDDNLDLQISANKDGIINEKITITSSDDDLYISEEHDTKLRRKIDLCMFPLMCLTYAIQFMDKVAVSSASIMGLREDLDVHDNLFSWVGSAFYFGYLFMNLGPVQLIFQKNRYMAKTLGLFIVLWGVLSTCQAATNINYGGFMALRVLIGCAESVVTPCFTVLTAQYWKSDEQFTRISIWFGMNGIGSILLNAIAYGVYIDKDTYSIPAWKILFIIIGCLAIVVGGLITFWIPDDPLRARFLTPEEKIMVMARTGTNEDSYRPHGLKKAQIIEAFKDIRTWLYFFFTVTANIPNGGISNFISILLQEDFKYTSKESILMTLPTGAVEFVGCPLFGILAIWCANKKIPFFKYKLAWALNGAFLSLIASCLLAYAGPSQARLAGAYLWYISPIAFICVLANISTNASGYTKIWTVSSINLVSFAAANIAGPQCFIDKQAPSYQGAKTALVVCYCIMVVILAILLCYNISENRKRDRLQSETGPQELAPDVDPNDMTDFENPNFRYTL